MRRPTPRESRTTKLVLGIDASWTPLRPSGYALIAVEVEGPRCLGVAASARAFLESLGRKVAKEDEAFEAIPETLRKAWGPLAVAAIDMPLAPEAILARRAADDELTRAYATRGIGTHSPMRDRPGKRSPRLLELLDLPLRTADDPTGSIPAALETYPHPALLTLLGAAYRVPYKVSRSLRYWPGATTSERIVRLQATHRSIEEALRRRLRDVPEIVPRTPVTRLAHLKPVEDALDALVCAWVGTLHLAGRTRAHGDGSSAIWVPSDDVCPIENGTDAE